MLTTKKRPGGLAVLVLTGLGLAMFTGCTPAGPRALLQGERLIRQGKFNQAVVKLEQATVLLPQSAPAWNHLGLAYHGLGRVEDAARAYHEALSRDRDLAAARYNLGCLYLEQNNLAPAIREFTTFTALQPTAVGGWLKLGTACLRARQLEAAERSFNAALRQQNRLPEALNGLGLVQAQRRRYAEAMQLFNAALRSQPDYAPALLNAAVVAQQHLSNRALALQRYRQYLALRPTPPNAAAVQQLVFQLEAEARAAAQPAPAIGPSAPLPLSTSPPALVTLPAERPPAPAVPDKPASPPERTRTPAVEPAAVAAETPAERAAAPDKPAETASSPSEKPRAVVPPAARPTVPAAATSNALVSAATPAPPVEPPPTAPGRETVAVTRPPIEPARAESAPLSDLPAPSTYEGPRYHYVSPPAPRNGDRAEAERWLAQGARAQERNRLSEAVECYRQAAQADPAMFEAHYNLGVAYYELRDLPQTLLAYEYALATQPASLKARFNLAIALQDAHYPRDAADELETLLLRHPGETRIHYALANLYARELREPDKAREHYQRVLKLDPQYVEATAIRFWLEANP
jgi:tetratricopeptide (TPR) repeat protein